ncbi:helix-turn-helix domain-containing protein [Ammoniphilus oxalaticus]|uniref:helix-turn-helix domain-containing protein n=1 Tax=Ammoniphilus oxalaticus TaxID=66863 RepID=UPI000E75FADE|nr:helix-turn-helix transcriptional regulator [Ammoniphilus oxalaticus]
MEGYQLGNRIRAFRKLKGYTQLEFAEKLGISISLLGSVERGMRDPSEQLLENISELLNIDMDELLKLDHREGI